MREFRSSLPNLLDKSGQLVVPVTLTVGDYILTPDICVERKSLDDLVQSFASGRLYAQCELMTAHYRQPVLLIEFEENRAFSIQVDPFPFWTLGQGLVSDLASWIGIHGCKDLDPEVYRRER